MATQQQTTITYQGGGETTTQPTDTAYQWLIAWGVMIVVLSLLNRTRVGHVLIYYSLWLVLILLLVTQYKYIAKVLAPLGQPIPKQ